MMEKQRTTHTDHTQDDVLIRTQSARTSLCTHKNSDHTHVHGLLNSDCCNRSRWQKN